MAAGLGSRGSSHKEGAAGLVVVAARTVVVGWLSLEQRKSPGE